MAIQILTGWLQGRQIGACGHPIGLPRVTRPKRFAKADPALICDFVELDASGPTFIGIFARHVQKSDKMRLHWANHSHKLYMLMIISTLRVGPSRARSFLLLKLARSPSKSNCVAVVNVDRRSRM